MNFERTFVKPTLFSFAIFSSSLPPPPLCALFSCLWDGSATRNTHTLPFSTPCFFRGGVVGGGGQGRSSGVDNSCIQTGFISFLLFILLSLKYYLPVEYLLPSTCHSIEALIETAYNIHTQKITVLH